VYPLLEALASVRIAYLVTAFVVANRPEAANCWGEQKLVHDGRWKCHISSGQ
jgi:hypothetical protein